MLAGAVALTASGPAAAEATCHAVTRIGEELHLVSRAGKSIHRYTDSSQPQPDPYVSLAVSPDGKRIAYVPDEPDPEQLLVADSSGRAARFRLLAPEGDVYGTPGILELGWVDGSLLQVVRHLNPRVGLMGHYRIPTHAVPAVMELAPSVARLAGEHCTIATRTHAAACIRESVVSVGDERVYPLAWYDGLRPVETLMIPFGAEATPAGTQVRIMPRRAVEGGVVLDVNYGGGTTTAQLGAGDALEVADDDARYALIVGMAGKGIRVEVITDGQPPWAEMLEPVVAWRDDGRQLAVIENLSLGKQLSLLQQIGTTKPAVWSAVAKAALPVEGSVRQMRFVSPSRLFIATEGPSFLFPVAVKRSGRQSKIVLGQALVLPETIEVQRTPGVAPQPSKVLGWVCTQS